MELAGALFFIGIGFLFLLIGKIKESSWIAISNWMEKSGMKWLAGLYFAVGGIWLGSYFFG